MRAFLAALLILAGFVLTFPAVLAGWEQRVLMNQDRFVSLGTEILQDEAVQSAVSDAAAQQVLDVAAANGADGSISQDQADTAARAVIGTLPDSPLGQTVLASTQHLIATAVEGPSASVQARRNRIVLDLRPVVERVINAMSVAYPALGTIQLPEDTGQITVLHESEAGKILDAARWFNDSAIYIVLLPIVAFGLAVLVASNRPLALIFVGLAAIASAVIRIALFKGPVDTLVIDLTVGHGGATQAAHATYNAIADSFVAQDLLVIAAGFAVLVVGAALLVVRRSY